MVFDGLIRQDIDSAEGREWAANVLKESALERFLFRMRFKCFWNFRPSIINKIR